MREYIDTKDLAKMLREYVKGFKGYKFSITSKKFAGGQSLRVDLVSGNTHLHDIEKVKKYCEKERNKQNYIDTLAKENLTLEDLYNDPFRCDRLVMGTVNQYTLGEEGYDTREKLLDKNVNDMFIKINNFIKQYHWCESDAMTDYYVCNFYYDLHISYDYNIIGCDKKLVSEESLCKTHEELYNIMNNKKVRIHWLGSHYIRKDMIGIFHTKKQDYEVLDIDTNKVIMQGLKTNDSTRILNNGFEKVENSSKDFPPFVRYTMIEE